MGDTVAATTNVLQPALSTLRLSHARVERVLETMVIVAALASVPLTFAQLEGNESLWTLVADWTIWCVFVLDYVVLLALSGQRLRFVRRHWLNAAVIVLTFPMLPALLGGLRLTRLVRLVRLLRLVALASRTLAALGLVLGRRGLIYVATLAALVVCGGAAALAIVEPDTVEGNFWNALWWALVTSTTVGYGDIAPATVAGRLIGVVIMLTGIGLVSTLAATVAAYFVAQDENTDLVEMRQRLARIELLLERQAAQRADGERHSSGSQPDADRRLLRPQPRA